MTLRIFLGWLIPLIFSMATLAEDIQVNPVHPTEYMVVEGDTLWNIAGKFLKKPAQWPKVWHSNGTIKNPDLIYPGDILAFSMINGKPQVSIADTNRDSLIHLKNQGHHYEKLSPQIRETPIAEAIKLLPVSAIDQFLTSPKVVGDNELASAPYILSFTGGHIVAGAGDKLYVRGITDPNTLNYTVYRKGKPYIDPESHALLGYEAEFIADATVQQAGDPATLLVNKSASELRPGDRLMNHTSGEQILNFFPHPPEKPIHGNIISVLNGVSQIGQYNIVVINKGLAEGLVVGHVLDVYQRGHFIRDPYAETQNAAVKLPDELAGSLMIFRVFDHVSYGLIMNASQSIHLLDTVQTP